MRYWLSNGDGQSYGPYELHDLRAYAAEGRVNAGSQLCAEGSSQWVPASSIITVAGGLNAPSPQAWTPVSLVGPIMVTLCCCVIGGIVSIVYAANANTKGARGDIAGATRDAASSKNWMMWSVILGGFFTIVMVAMQVFAASNSRW